MSDRPGRDHLAGAHGSVAAVIPAAGYSSRMGRFKPLLPLDQETIIERVISSFEAIGVTEIIVVVGHHKDRLMRALDHRQVQIIVNPDYTEGMFSSITAGITRISPHCRAFFMLPADIPLVRPQTLVKLLEMSDNHPGSIIKPIFQEKRGHPPLIPCDLIPAIRQWQRPGGLKAFLKSCACATLECPVPDHHILLDMDTPADYLEIVQQWHRFDIPTAAECRFILTTIHPISPRIMAHSRMVALVAERMGRALTSAGLALNLDLISAGAWLHDLAKGRKNHAQVAETLIHRMGFPRIGSIVGAHTDLKVGEHTPVTETEVVHLADKWVKGDSIIPLAMRFQGPLNRWDKDPLATEHIIRRRDAAFLLQKKMEAILGSPLEKIIGCGPHSSPKKTMTDRQDQV